jgi:hypothetical protein
MIHRRGRLEKGSPSPSRTLFPEEDDDKNPKANRRYLQLFLLATAIVSIMYVVVFLAPSPHVHLAHVETVSQPTVEKDKRWDPAPRDENGVHYHIVFSTGCSIYQDWQSFVFFYHAMAVNQPGTVTRIVSGCNEEEESTLQALFDQQIKPMAPERFKIHFTPDYSNVKGGKTKFVYFNKPFGMRHWLQTALGFPYNPIDEDSIVVLMDPDQLILRPFRNNDFTNTQWKFVPSDQKPRTKIEHGYPMGQLYGFALQWKQKIDMTLVSPNEPSPVTTMSNEEARAGYIVGPPYIATGK